MGESAAPFGDNDTGQSAHKKIFELALASTADFFMHISPRLVISKFELVTWCGDKYGVFITDVISFIILGFVVFLFIKAYNKMKKEEPKAAPSKKVCSQCAMEIPVAAKVCGYCGNKEV